MQYKESLAKVAALICALLEAEEGGIGPVPASSLYLALQCDMESYLFITRLAVEARFITKTATTIQLTAEGRAKARDIEKLLAEKSSKLKEQTDRQ